MTMTDERLAELDAAIARFPVSLPWYSCATSRNGVTGIHGEPHGEPPHQGVAYLADVFGDAAPVVEAMNSLPDLRAHIDAQAATIAANTEREIHLTYVLKGLLGAYEAIVRQTGKDDLLRDDAPTWRNTARTTLLALAERAASLRAIAGSMTE